MQKRLRTLENRTSMMAKAIMPVLDVLKGRIADTNQILMSIESQGSFSNKLD